MKNSIFAILTLAFIWIFPISANAMATHPQGDGHKLCMASCQKADPLVDAASVSGIKLAAYAIGDDLALEYSPAIKTSAYGSDEKCDEKITHFALFFVRSDMRLNL